MLDDLCGEWREASEFSDAELADIATYWRITISCGDWFNTAHREHMARQEREALEELATRRGRR